MHYLTDNPWPAIIVLTGLAVVAFVLGQPTLRKLGIGLLLAACSLYLIAHTTISTQEQIEASAGTILQGFQNEDLDGVRSMISGENPKLIEIAERGLELVKLENDFHIQSVQIESESDTQVVARIRANGNITERSQSMRQRTAEFWETTWVRTAEDWKLSDAVRLNPVTGKPRGTFDRM